MESKELLKVAQGMQRALDQQTELLRSIWVYLDRVERREEQARLAAAAEAEDVAFERSRDAFIHSVRFPSINAIAGEQTGRGVR